MYATKTACRACGCEQLSTYLDLGMMPLANGLLDSEHDPEERFPLAVNVCEQCFFSQLSVVVDPAVLYSNYVYRSSMSDTFRRHCKALADDLALEKSDLIIDIASNDGVLLEQFDCRRLGVEPATNLANLASVPTVNEFWSRNLGRNLAHEYGTAKIVTAFNVFAHVDNLRDFVLGVRNVLRADGYFIIEVPHLLPLMRDMEFDTIYHEHLSYVLLRPLIEFFVSCFMDVVRVEEQDIHGGTLRIYVQHQGLHDGIDASVEEFIAREESAGMYDMNTYQQWGQSVNERCREVQQIVNEAREKGESIAGFAASAKGCTLLNAAQVKLDYLFDSTPEKVGKISPGLHIPIVHSDRLTEIAPDHLLLLAWNFEEEIMRKHNDYRGRWIVPIPSLRFV